MSFIRKKACRAAVRTGTVAILGLAGCSNIPHQASKDDSDFVQLLDKRQGTYHWSDYKKTSSGHEVFKNLTLENQAGKIWVGELALDNFRYDKQADTINAGHIHARNVSLESIKGMRITVEDLDVPRLVSNDQLSETKVDIRRLLFFRAGSGPAVNEDTVVIPQASYSMTENYVTDDVVVDFSATVKDTLSGRIRVDYVGARNLKRFEDAHRNRPDSLEFDGYMSYMMDNMKMRSLDIELEDQGLVRDLTDGYELSNSYAKDIADCRKDEKRLPKNALKICQPIINVLHGRSKTLRLSARPLQPVSLRNLHMATRSHDTESVLQLGRTLNMRVTN